MAEQIANKGYAALKKETTKGAAVVPDTYVPVYEESLTTNINLDDDTPIIGNKFARFAVVQGQRSHNGDIKVLAEPNTAARFYDMLLTKGATSGAGPYTHPFTLSTSTNPNSYTLDIARGQIVFRYIGVEASKISPEFSENKMLFNISVSALKSFSVREISSIATNVITLKTNYDPKPTEGLVVGDLIRLFLANGTTVDTTVTALTDTTVTVGSAGAAAANDFLALRPASSPSLTVVTPFLWSRTEFRFAADATTALSAAQTRLEKGSSWSVMHNFKSDEGELRSGGFDPAVLARTVGDLEFNANLHFDTPEDLNRFLTVAKRAVVIRCFSDTGYELRVTINNMKIGEDPVHIRTGEIIYSEMNFKPVYDTADAQPFDVKVINNVATI